MRCGRGRVLTGDIRSAAAAARRRICRRARRSVLILMHDQLREARQLEYLTVGRYEANRLLVGLRQEAHWDVDDLRGPR